MTAILRRSLRVVVIAVIAVASTITAADPPTGQPAWASEVGVGRAGLLVARGVAALDHHRGRRTAGPGPGSDHGSEFGPVTRQGTGHAVPLEAGQAASTLGVLVVDGGTHQCSASVVASDSRRLLATAAHCVWLDGGWTLEGAYFVPGYHDGQEPWGRWPVEAAWVSRSWQDANSPIEDVASAHDVAFVRLAADRSGALPEDVLGSQGIWFAAPATAAVTAVGYPIVGAFDGEQPERCTDAADTEQTGEQTADGRTGADSRDSSDRSAGQLAAAGGEVLVIECDLTQGASGGPWLIGPQAQTGWGQVIGVVSGGSGSQLVSPRFGPEAEEVYHAADTGTDLQDSP